MDSINSWINEEEVRKLAEELSVTTGRKVKADEDLSKDFAEPLEKKTTSIAEILQEETTAISENGDVRIPNEVKAEKALSLANASAMAASVGLIASHKKTVEDMVKPAKLSRGVQSLSKYNSDANKKPLCDSYVNAVPVNVDTSVKRSPEFPSVHNSKGLDTFVEMDKHLKESVKAEGICVVDRDGDVLYSTLTNKALVAFSIKTILNSKLLQTQEGEVGNIRLKLSAHDFFEFVAVKSTRGVIVLSTRIEKTLGSDLSRKVADDMLKIANRV